MPAGHGTPNAGWAAPTLAGSGGVGVFAGCRTCFANRLSTSVHRRQRPNGLQATASCCFRGARPTKRWPPGLQQPVRASTEPPNTSNNLQEVCTAAGGHSQALRSPRFFGAMNGAPTCPLRTVPGEPATREIRRAGWSALGLPAPVVQAGTSRRPGGRRATPAPRLCPAAAARHGPLLWTCSDPSHP